MKYYSKLDLKNKTLVSGFLLYRSIHLPHYPTGYYIVQEFQMNEYFSETYWSHRFLLVITPQEQLLPDKPQQCTIVMQESIHYKKDKSM